MKAKFKVGDKVRVNLFPKLNYRCKVTEGMLELNGEILTISEEWGGDANDSYFDVISDGHTYRVEEAGWYWTSAMFVKVNNQEIMETKTVKLTLEQARELYNQGGNFRTIALGAYSEEELTKPSLPNTWEEFCDNYPIKNKESWINGDSAIIIRSDSNRGDRFDKEDKNLLPNKETAEAMLALCQLIQLRDCYNQGWKPNWNTVEYKPVIKVYKGNVVKDSYTNTSFILTFKTLKLRDKFFENFKDLLETAKELL